MSSRRARLASHGARDPWRRAPVSELQDQVLPRWFVLTALIMVPVALLVVAAAFAVFGPDEVPVAARRPPPAQGLTHDVGEYQIGPTQPVAVQPRCPALEGLRIAGTEDDRRVLTMGLAQLCRAPAEPAALVERFSQEDGVVRFAVFADTGVDSAASTDTPLILVNNRFAVAGEPSWIAPLIVHDLTVLQGTPGTAETALAARQAESQACQMFVPEPSRSRACRDAADLLALDDPLAALRDAGYQ